MAQYYFDMDGVLAVYDRAGYLPASAGETPAYLKPGYFRNRAIDERICFAFLRLLYESQYDTPEHTIRCLTTVSSTGSLFVQQYHDKNAWLYQMLQHMKKRYQKTFLSNRTSISRNPTNASSYLLSPTNTRSWIR